MEGMTLSGIPAQISPYTEPRSRSAERGKLSVAVFPHSD